VAETAASCLAAKYPGLQIAGFFSPPFGAVSEEALQAQCATIAASGANVVWVALGCPKQEIWISRASKLLSGVVLLAVGQAMDIEAGLVNRAPERFRKFGCEWLYRLLTNPRRLWKRYLDYNSIFLYSIAKIQLKGKSLRG
jgi:N-acetylglucosaminyldiphosphoundecaprenol N-acetyl-beta-D-mannosaminyltransferase